MAARVAVRPPGPLVLGGLSVLLVASLLFAAAFGAVQLRPDDLVRMTLNHLFGPRFEPTWRPQDEAIFFAIRLPRVAGAAIVGAALASAGVLFQGLLRNPLADPYALGGGWLLRHSLDALTLGEESAQQLGIAVESDKRLVIVLGSILTGAAVALGGLIGFVGLFAPHVTRTIVGPRHTWLLPAAALVGAAFLVLADLLARALLPPTEIPVGILTAFVGGPFFLWLLRRERREYRL